MRVVPLGLVTMSMSCWWVLPVSVIILAAPVMVWQNIRLARSGSKPFSWAYWQKYMAKR